MRAPVRRWRGTLAASAALLLSAPAAVEPPAAVDASTPDTAAAPDTSSPDTTSPDTAAAATPTRRAAATEPCVTHPSAVWPIVRLAGETRFDTAACAALTGYPDGAATVVLARGDTAGEFADALAGTVLARALDAPVLLTGPTTLAAPARDAIAALGPEQVLVLGGPVAISDAVVAQVGRLVGDVERVAGASRAATAAQIAERVPGEAAFVVNGRRPADALTAGAAAARSGAALLLVETHSVPDATRRALTERTSATIVGGPGVVAASTERAVRRWVGPDVRRLGGPTRYETAATVAREHPGDGVLHLVSGADANLVDAIAAGWFAALPGGGPVVYTTREAPDRATDRYLRLGPLADAPETRVFGGPVSIADPMITALEQRYAEAAGGGPPDQQRGLWVHLFDDSLKTRAGIERVLDTAVAANLNTVVVQGARRHDAFYDSDVLPATTDPDLEVGLDLLETLVPAAHARGLQVHVWYSVMPSTHPSMQDEPLGPDHVNVAHGAHSGDPWVVPGWTPGYEFLDPAVPGVQRHVVAMVREVVERYAVDGVHLDYLRYPCLRANDNGTCASSEPGDGATHNQHPTTMRRWRQHGGGQDLADFLRSQTEDLTRRILLEVADVDPSVVVSAALIAQREGPVGQDLRQSFQQTRAYYEKGQDWLAWLEGGLLDHAYPMAYFREADPTYARWYDEWARFADRTDTPRHVTALGQAAYLNCVAESLSQLDQATSTLDGAMVYSYQGDVAGGCAGQHPGDLFRALSAPGGPFATPAGVPDVPRRTSPTTGHVLVRAEDGDRVELAPLSGSQPTAHVRADATGHAGFVDVAPGQYLVGVDGGAATPIRVTAGEVTRVG